MTRKIFENEVNGIPLKFYDHETSNTPDFVFGELIRDYYGLSQCEIGSDDLVLDIGANVGMFSILAHKMFGCRVLALEPVPFLHDCFVKNLTLNDCDVTKFVVLNSAVGDNDEPKTLYYREWESGNTSGQQKTRAHKLEVPCTSIQSLLEEHSPAYLKIDCEGAEWQIVPAMLDRLPSALKYIGIEVHASPTPQSRPEALLEALQTCFNGRIYATVAD